MSLPPPIESGPNPQNPPTVAVPARILEVTDSETQRIDNFLIGIMKTVPRTRIYKMLRKGEVRVNGGRIKPSYRLKKGDRVRVPPHRADAQRQAPFVADKHLEVLEGAILFEDEKLLVLDKPSGMAVHGGSGLSFGVIEAMRRLRPEESLELVHRLDRDTSGCLLLAKKPGAVRKMHELIRLGRMDKTYRLIAHGRWPRGSASITLPLLRYHTASGERRVRVDDTGKACRTDFEVEAYGARATLLRARLHTGRTHQIRVHALSSGHAIVGDVKYASREELELARTSGITRLCLHANRIAFPWNSSVLSFESPTPAAFTHAWKRLS